jgi:phenylalanyl-tRNA synthetase beta subunit
VNPIELVVNDGLMTATNAMAVEVITTAEAVERLITQVASSWSRSRPLLATLRAALHSIERGNSISAINQLQAFQNKVRAQMGRRDPALAASLIQMAQEIIEALNAANGNPGALRYARSISLAK